MARKVAIIGGGVSGVTTALTLGSMGLEVTLFEKNSTLVSGPPFCHLHAGGNLYREISDDQCLTLLRQSIDFAKLYPFAIDKRPTVIALPTSDPQEPIELLKRLELLRSHYRAISQNNPSNALLGPWQNYFELFSKEQIVALSKQDEATQPKSNQEWLIPFAKHIDLERIKFPIIVVQEYGINLFRVGAGAGLALESMPNVTILRECEVTNVTKSNQGFRVSSKLLEEEFDYLVNASGFRSGYIDDMLGIKQPRMVEFKAAFTAHWEQRSNFWPEVIFHGERGTPRGMGQFTPYCSGYVQLHAMTQDITLCGECLAKSDSVSSYPKLSSELIKRVEFGWQSDAYKVRTKRAINYLAQFFPEFAKAKVGGKPLYGVQQIPGSDPSLRVAEVAFPAKNYARCEIVKVSSVVDMVKAIVENMQESGLLEFKSEDHFEIQALKALPKDTLAQRAALIAKRLGYPQEMSKVCNPL